jgi:fructose-1,6-bisphosphatase/inositol monophosphatase family enzyme
MTIPDLDRVAQVIRDVAARELVPKFLTLAAHEVAEKRPGDFVTAVDHAMEKALAAALQPLLPGSVIVGEEAVFEAPVWVLDPLDGTGNFTQGLPIVAVLVALVVKGETVAGWVYDPLTDRMAIGEKGAGAFMGSRRLHVTRPAEDRSLNGSIYGRFVRTSEEYQQIYGRGRGLLGNVFNARCVGQEYLARLKGRMHFGVYTRMNPWDHAAGILLHQEAGGVARMGDGSDYRPAERGYVCLLTPDEDLWQTMHDQLIKPAMAADTARPKS